MNTQVDTIYLDMRAFGFAHSMLSRIDSLFISTLHGHYSETVYQYILYSDASGAGPFRDNREMKRLFHSHSYTYSRIGSSPSVRVMLKTP